MACTGTQIQWTITLETFPSRHGFRYTKQDLIFCLDIINGTVSGAVFDTSNNKIDDVTGRQASSGQAGVDFIRINFRWPPADVVMIGMMFLDGRPKFHGRYLTIPAGSVAAEETLAIPIGPDSGDTGTGTGQTT